MKLISADLYLKIPSLCFGKGQGTRVSCVIVLDSCVGLLWGAVLQGQLLWMWMNRTGRLPARLKYGENVQ